MAFHPPIPTSISAARTSRRCRKSSETIEKSGIRSGLEIDLVTHDVAKFFGLLLKKNGYVLEQLLSPLVVQSSPEHEEFKALARGCITKHHAHHYLGFANTQWKLFAKEDPPRVKPLLYVYRVLLNGHSPDANRRS
jgi:predicted nucleotidyltransferase